MSEESCVFLVGHKRHGASFSRVEDSTCAFTSEKAAKEHLFVEMELLLEELDIQDEEREALSNAIKQRDLFIATRLWTEAWGGEYAVYALPLYND